MQKRIISAGLVLAIILILFPIGTIQASTWNNAYSYYNNYGDSVVFKPTSNTDGNIYYATKAAIATTNVRYKTIGWKVTVRKLSGSTLQTIYFKLGGSYMNRVNARTKSGYEYNLYSLSLYNLKRRLNTKASKAMETGQADIILDACMIVVNNGKEQGAMNDSGPTSGTVYMSQSGISGAANWSSSAKKSFSSYYNKLVEGLFFRVVVDTDAGIKGVSGEGYYCYGSYVTLKADVKTGYDFAMWEGDIQSAKPEISFYVTKEERLFARTEVKRLIIMLHRNFGPQDTAAIWQEVRYTDAGDVIVQTNWKNNGKTMLGWSLSRDAKTPEYSEREEIKKSWFQDYTPQLNLYAVWEDDSSTSTKQPADDSDTSNSPDHSPELPTPPGNTPDNPPTVSPDPADPGVDIVMPPENSAGTDGQGQRKIRCRFISSKYFEDAGGNLISSAQGGLDSDSRWAVDPMLRQLLRQVLKS